MRKYISIMSLFAFFAIFSCVDEDTFPNEVENGLEKGGFIKFQDLETVPAVVDVNNFDLTRTIVDPNNNVTSATFDLIATVGGQENTYENVFEITSFPFELKLNMDVLSMYTNIDSSNFSPGDTFRFISDVERNDGTIFNRDNTDATLFNPSYANAMDFGFSLACAFDPSEAVGMYEVVYDPFDTILDNDPIEAVMDGDDTVIFKDIFGHGYDVSVKITDLQIGGAEVEKQEAWHCDNWGCGYGVGSVQGAGTFTSCIGKVDLNLKHTVAAGSFGTYQLVLQKL